MEKRDTILLAVTLLSVSVLLQGEFCVYFAADRYSTQANSDGSYSISASKNNVYDSILIDNGSFDQNSGLVIYYDPTYGSKVNIPLTEIGARALDENYYIIQLKNNLQYLGITDIEMLNAEQLLSFTSDSTKEKYGLVVLSGALPDTVYDGTSDSKIIDWISKGGRLYWAGQRIGAYIGHSDKTVEEVSGDYQKNFLGQDDCLCPMKQDDTRRAGTAYSDYTDNNLRYSLSLKNNNILYSVDTSKLTSEYFAAGYSMDGYVSTIFVKNGYGQICVMGGDFSNHQRMDLQTLISAGICQNSKIVDWQHGTISKGTAGGIFDVSGITGNKSIFILIGGDFAVYGRLHKI